MTPPACAGQGIFHAANVWSQTEMSKEYELAADILSVIFAFTAAGLWGWSAWIKLPRQFPIIVVSSHSESDIIPAGEVYSVGSSPQLDELGKAVIRQSELSRYAAVSAAITALCQGFAIFLRIISN